MNPLEDVITGSPKLRPNTKRTYLADVREFLAFVQEKLPDDATQRWARDWADRARPVVETWRDALLKRGLDASTVNGKLAALRYATKRWADRTGDQAFNFATYAEMLSTAGKEAKPRGALTLDNVRSIVMSCKRDKSLAGLRDTAMVMLAAYTGLRREALAQIELKDIDTTFCIRVELKGGKKHTMPPLDPRARAPLAAYIAALYKALGVTPNKLAGRVFRKISRGGDAAKVGTALSTNGLYFIIVKRAAAVGLKVYPHLFRHTFVTMMEEAGLGHLVPAYTGHRVQGGAPVARSQDGYTDHVAIATRAGTSGLPDLGS